MFDGKAFGAEIVEAVRGYVGRALEPILSRIASLEARAPIPGEKGEKGDPGEPGKDGAPGRDADPELIKALVAEAVAQIPAPRDGKDADPEAVAALVDESVARAVAALPKPEPVEVPEERIAALVEARVAEVVEARVAEAVARAVAALPVPQDGKDGEPGRDGRDADPAEVQAMVDESVARAVAAIKLPKGDKGDPGEKGEKGEDGIGMAGAMIDRQGNLIITMTDGSIHALGLVVGRDGEPGKDGAPGRDGRDGVDGRDGLGFEDMEAEYDGERTVTVKFAREGIVKTYAWQFPVVIDRGVYKAGQQYEAGDAVTFGGSLWIAQKSTSGKPQDSDDWRLAVKRGRDGKDGAPGDRGPQGPEGKPGRDLTQMTLDGKKY